MVFPNCGPLPQISQTRAITLESFQACCRNLDFTGMSPISPKQNRTVSTGNLFATRAGGVCVATSVPSLRDSTLFLLPSRHLRAGLSNVALRGWSSGVFPFLAVLGVATQTLAGRLLRRLAHHRLRTMAAPAG